MSALAQGSFQSWDERRLGIVSHSSNAWKSPRVCRTVLPAFDRVDEYIFQSANLNERTAKLIAQRVGKDSCDHIANTRDVPLYPVVYWSLKANASCPAATLERLEAMLKQQQAFVEAPKKAQQFRNVQAAYRQHFDGGYGGCTIQTVSSIKRHSVLVFKSVPVGESIAWRWKALSLLLMLRRHV